MGFGNFDDSRLTEHVNSFSRSRPRFSEPESMILPTKICRMRMKVELQRRIGHDCAGQ